MEKKYLEILGNGKIIGAFEDVKNVEEKTEGRNKVLSFDSSEGHFNFKQILDYKGDKVGYLEDAGRIAFEAYRVVGRRTLLRHADQAGVYIKSKRKGK